MAKAKPASKPNGAPKSTKATKSNKEVPAPVKALPVTLLSGFLVRTCLVKDKSTADQIS